VGYTSSIRVYAHNLTVIIDCVGLAAEAAGFKRLVREATVESGNTTDVNLVVQVGASPESVTVKAAPRPRFTMSPTRLMA